MHVLTVPNQKHGYVPAAAVIRRWQALSGNGRKARVGGFKSDEKPTAQPWRVIGNWKT